MISHFLSSASLIGLLVTCEIAPAAAPPVISIAVSPDGASIVSCSQSMVAIYDTSNLKTQREIRTGLEIPHHAAFSPSGTALAIGGGTPAESGSIELYEWPSCKRTQVLDGHADSVMSIAWLSENRLASVGLDHRVLVWDLESGTVLNRFDGHSRGVVTACVLPAQNLLITAGLDQNIRVWDLRSGELRRGMSIHVKPVTAVAARPAREGLPMIASASDDGTVRFWQPTIGRMVRFARLPSRPRDLAWLADGTKVIACCDDGRIYAIDPETIEVSEPIDAVDEWAYCLAVHANETSVFVGGAKNSLRRVELTLFER